ncbi:Uncharacterized protein APZ42_002365 [Daphnia magna]|uniref:Uncharacterized protein n=1 Tax=Daphnia magna TaxID=35525 RepID=A0A164IB76_9CRUS|nr:Uncharacterized protein APZ42_002365 [Daphnia magna]
MDFLLMAAGINDVPMPADQLGADVAGVLDRDRVAEGVQVLRDIGLFGQDLHERGAFELRLGHAADSRLSLWPGRYAATQALVFGRPWSFCLFFATVMTPQQTLYLPADGWPRCRWCAAAPGDAVYLEYHDSDGAFLSPMTAACSRSSAWRAFSRACPGAPSSTSVRPFAPPLPTSRSSAWPVSARPMSSVCCRTPASCATAARLRR